MREQCAAVFTEVDHDSSGTLSSAEVHVAVLLVYSRLNQILGSSALPMPTRHQVMAMVAEADCDGNAVLSQEEFSAWFSRKFMRRIAGCVAAHVLAKKVLVPAGALWLSLAASQ